MKVRLETRDGGFVSEIEILPFQLPPEVIVWGQRFFQQHEVGPVSVYRECFAYFVPLGN